MRTAGGFAPPPSKNSIFRQTTGVRGQSGWRVGLAHNPHTTTGLYNHPWLFVFYILRTYLISFILFFIHLLYLFYFTFPYLFNRLFFSTAFSSVYFLPYLFSLTGHLALISRTWNLGDAQENTLNHSVKWWQPLRLASPPTMVYRFTGNRIL